MNWKEKISVISHSCAALGVLETLKELSAYTATAGFDIDDNSFDRKFNTDTTARISNEDLEIVDFAAQRSATMYRTAPERFVRFLIGSLDIDFQNYDFVDIGCGKGRVLLIASDYAFRSIRGVELSRYAYTVAKKNLTIYQSERQKCFDVQVENVDARHYEPRVTNTVYYFFEPFQFPFLVAVLGKIASSLNGKGKEIRIICVWSDLTFALPFIDQLGFEMTRHRKLVINELNYSMFSLLPR